MFRIISLGFITFSFEISLLFSNSIQQLCELQRVGVFTTLIFELPLWPVPWWRCSSLKPALAIRESAWAPACGTSHIPDVPLSDRVPQTGLQSGCRPRSSKQRTGGLQSSLE